jgi:hypothetical protein
VFSFTKQCTARDILSAGLLFANQGAGLGIIVVASGEELQAMMGGLLAYSWLIP